jgi:hypothetical protein
LPSVARTALVSCTSLPASRFTRLDLPTPDRPMSTATAPGGNEGPQALDAFGAALRHHHDVDARRRHGPHMVAHGIDLIGAFGQVGLGERHHHMSPRALRKHELAFQAPLVELVHGVRHDYRIEVHRKHLSHRALGRIASHKLARARLDFGDLRDVGIFGHFHLHAIAHLGAHIGPLHQGHRMLAAKPSTVGGFHQGKSAVDLHHQSRLAHHRFLSRMM